MSTTVPELTLGQQFQANVLAPLKSTFVGKDEVIDVLGVCLAAGENLFILGPPGTAKSALVGELGRRLDGKTFEYLLTRFTEPNELFGPFDIRKLREGELITNTEGMLPEADLVFLDELLNANSAILNSLLTVLNERMFRRGRETRKLPTLMVVGASNRLPSDDTLGALFDRFLLRVRCENVPSERLHEVLREGWLFDTREKNTDPSMQMSDIARLQDALKKIDFTEVRPTYVDLIHRIRHAGIQISDRRAVKLQRLVGASAMLCGRFHASVSDLWVFRYIWDTEEQLEVLAAIVEDVIGRRDTHPDSHPLARSSQAPDPESLARDLDRIATQLQANPSDTERAFLKDRLAILSGRCQWVRGDEQRTYLQERVDELWKILGVDS